MLREQERAVPGRAASLEDLHRAVGADVRFGILELDAMTYIEKRQNCAVSQFSAAATLPLHATAGGRSCWPSLRIANSVSSSTVGSRPSLRAPSSIPTSCDGPEEVRLNGFAVADRELRSDCTTIAAPIFGAGGRIVAALDVDVADPASAFDCVRPALSVAASGLSRELERPCEHCQSLVAGGEERSELRPNGHDRRGQRWSGGSEAALGDLDSIRFRGSGRRPVGPDPAVKGEGFDRWKSDGSPRTDRPGSTRRCCRPTSAGPTASCGCMSTAGDDDGIGALTRWVRPRPN